MTIGDERRLTIVVNSPRQAIVHTPQHSSASRTAVRDAASNPFSSGPKAAQPRSTVVYGVGRSPLRATHHACLWRRTQLSTSRVKASRDDLQSAMNRPCQREHEHRDQKRPNEALNRAQQLRAEPGANRAGSQNKRNKRLDAQQYIPEPERRF